MNRSEIKRHARLQRRNNALLKSVMRPVYLTFIAGSGNGIMPVNIHGKLLTKLPDIGSIMQHTPFKWHIDMFVVGRDTKGRNKLDRRILAVQEEVIHSELADSLNEYHLNLLNSPKEVNLNHRITMGWIAYIGKEPTDEQFINMVWSTGVFKYAAKWEARLNN